jgi:alkylation response protein AidB-like acyl-CoA dehydrogenase
VKVDEREIVAGRAPFPYSEAFYQLVHLATLAGIGRAVASDAAAILASRKRSYSNAVTPRAAEDPQLLQVVGRARAHAWTAGAIVAQAARALERAAASFERPDALAIIAETEIEIWQAQTVASQLVLDASASVFDALGASATLRAAGLDRYWRNARTIASHNPRIYKDRIVGDFAVNGTLPPGQWRIGVA